MSTCRICSQDLTVELDSDSFDEASSSTVGETRSAPDDLLLLCGCHFHWQCLLDESAEVALSLACPVCLNSIVTGPTASSSEPRILTRYLNEGGLQENLDILPFITEEAYLDANPTARPARAFMTLCSEGDIGGIIELLKAIEADSDEGDLSPSELLRFEDPLDGGKCGLHVALENGQVEVVWLLLWLASRVPSQLFPDVFQQVAAREEVGRETSEGSDIRGIQDGNHRTASQLARGMGGDTWTPLLQAGILGD